MEPLQTMEASPRRERMETPCNPGLARTTAAQVGLVMKTKVEMYYFLAVESKCTCLRAGLELSSAVPTPLLRSGEHPAAVD